MLRDPATRLLLAFANISNVGIRQLASKELVLKHSILSDAQTGQIVAGGQKQC